MATVCVLRFADCRGAPTAVAAVQSLIHAGILNVTDVGTVTWQPRQRSPSVDWLREASSHPLLNEAFWYTLFGTILCLPRAASLAGHPGGPGRRSLAEFGISDDFSECLRNRILPGTSALFLLTMDATVDRVVAALSMLDFTVTSTNLTSRQLHALEAAFVPSGNEAAALPPHRREASIPWLLIRVRYPPPSCVAAGCTTLSKRVGEPIPVVSEERQVGINLDFVALDFLKGVELLGTPLGRACRGALRGRRQSVRRRSWCHLDDGGRL
jgi:uncharacterized membrane protein